MKLGRVVVWVILNISRGGVLRNFDFCGNGGHFSKWPPLKSNFFNISTME